MRIFILTITLSVFSFSCNTKPVVQNEKEKLDQLANSYVKLMLRIGVYDSAFVDAYYGPDSLKPVEIKRQEFPRDSLLSSVHQLQLKLKQFGFATGSDSLKARAIWIDHQLRAAAMRINIFSGNYSSFDQECKELFGVVPPVYDEKHFQLLIRQLDNLLPGKGDIPARFQKLADRFILPVDKLDTVFKTAIAEARKKTRAHYALPDSENIRLEYVNHRSWSGYNWYKGNYQSLVQINTDFHIFVDRAIDLSAHEGYPGHHVYNLLLEKNLYKEKGYPEISVYPLFCPQSLIAEGSANYGIEVTFPGKEKLLFCKEVLLPLAGLDTTGIESYLGALDIRNELNYARNEVGRGLLNGTMNEQEALRWLQQYCLYNKETAEKSIHFIRDNRTYIINYNFGKDLVKHFVEAKGGTEGQLEKRWEIFAWLLSNEINPEDLLSVSK